MTLRELELFYHLCETPHISQLAKKLSLSQSAISLAIKSLENKLTEPLFDRVGKKLILNERGRIFKESSYKHYLALIDAENIFKKDKLSGILKIASSKTVGNYIMPQIIYNFLIKYPNITISKDIKNSSQITQMLKSGEIDMGIIEMKCSESSIVSQELVDDRLIIVTSNKDLVKKRVYIDQLFDMKWILREQGSGTRWLFLDYISGISQKLDIFMEFTEFEEMKSLLLNNSDTITCVSKFVVEKELERGELFEVDVINFVLKRKLYLIYNKNKYKSTLFNSFKEYLQNSFKI